MQVSLTLKPKKQKENIMNKTIETHGKTKAGRPFIHIVNWQGGEVSSQFIEYKSHGDVGSITIPVRANVTVAETWHYVTSGELPTGVEKVFAT